MNSETVLKDFISSSYELIQDYDKRGRYYHTLTPADNSPTVVHKETNQLTDEMILFHIHIPDEGRDKDRYILEGEDYNRFESK